MASQTANTKKTGSWDLPLKVIKTGIVSWLIVFLFWGLGSLQYDEIFLPSPAETWTAIKELVSNGTLWADIAASVNRVLKGWGLAVVIAVPVGLVVGHFKPIRWIVEPILSLFRFIPAIALTSLFLMWFGVDDTSKVALILYAAFFQVLVNTIAGVVATDHSLMEAASCMGASRLRVFFTVVLPSAVPNIFTGIRLGLSSSIICVIAAEMLVGNDGLGYFPVGTGFPAELSEYCGVCESAGGAAGGECVYGDGNGAGAGRYFVCAGASESEGAGDGV